MTYNPKAQMTIAPRERRQIEISYRPTKRQHQFNINLNYKIVENQEIRRICAVTGSCHGIDLKYVQDQINFGPVTVNSKLTKKFVVSNIGDMPAKFNWELDFCSYVFDIKP